MVRAPYFLIANDEEESNFDDEYYDIEHFNIMSREQRREQRTQLLWCHLLRSAAEIAVESNVSYNSSAHPVPSTACQCLPELSSKLTAAAMLSLLQASSSPPQPVWSNQCASNAKSSPDPMEEIDWSAELQKIDAVEMMRVSAGSEVLLEVLFEDLRSCENSLCEDIQSPPSEASTLSTVGYSPRDCESRTCDDIPPPAFPDIVFPSLADVGPPTCRGAEGSTSSRAITLNRHRFGNAQLHVR